MEEKFFYFENTPTLNTNNKIEKKMSCFETVIIKNKTYRNAFSISSPLPINDNK